MFIQYTMDTIIYLKMSNRATGSQRESPPVFHLRLLKLWELPEYADRMDSLQILYVTLPPEVGQSPGWPGRLLPYLVPFFGYSASIATVYQEKLLRYLPEIMKEEWQRSWPYPIYEDYRRVEYAGLLVRKGMAYLQVGKTPGRELIHFYVLGFEAFVPEVLNPYLKYIGKLTCYTADHGELLEEYAEALYEAEGLAADCRLCEPKELRRLRLKCAGPALVLDMTGEEQVVLSACDGRIVWIDLDANQAKRRRIGGKSPETAYFSMKEEWESLDTADKNEYNT